MEKYLPRFIFDLDGTLALIDHRRAILTDKSIPSFDRWPRFYRACVDDEPNLPVLEILDNLHANYEIEIWSGRSDIVKTQTLTWLRKHLYYPLTKVTLRMREEGDFTPDDELKQQWLFSLPKAHRESIIAIFDDRQKVVDMWRRNGLTCLQVAQGDF
jgi:hypothetical protein